MKKIIEKLEEKQKIIDEVRTCINKEIESAKKDRSLRILYPASYFENILTHIGSMLDEI